MSPTLLLGLLAAASSPPAVAVTGACPGADAVTAALTSALGNEAGRQLAVAPKVTDDGDGFSVTALGQTRRYADPARDCDERARAAAVFIALALNPPVLPLAPESGIQGGAAPPTAVAAAGAAAAPASQRWLDLAVAARFDSGPGAATSAAFGFELGAVVGWRWLGVAATAGILAPSDSTISSVTVRQQRFPLSVALTARHGISPRLAAAGAMGVALVPFTVRGQSLDPASQSTRLDAGVRLAFALRLLATPRLAPFIGLHAELFPRAYQLDVAQLGTIGSTGRLWVGASAGLSFEATPAHR
jgi:hypothetical protein